MIAAATQSYSLDNLPFGWFDFLFIALLVLGFFRGRKNGMTKEFVPLLRWIAIVFAAGLGYEAAGQIWYNVAGVGRASSDVLGYLSVAFIVMLVFIPVEHFLTPRLTGSNFFGAVEYYLGSVSGVIRYLAIIFFSLALLHAPHYTTAEIQAQKDYAFRTFGGGEKGFTGNFFPTFQQVQESVFKNSLAGRNIDDYCGVILINSVPGETGRTPDKTSTHK